MANKSLFGAAPLAPPTNAINHAGGVAYRLTPKQALAQYACTGAFGDTYYAGAAEQLDDVLALLAVIEDLDFIGKLAVYARKRGHMKDMPALLCAHLSARGPIGVAVLAQVFPFVIDNAKMLRNFVQIVRSGKCGRKSFGEAPRRLINNWIGQRSSEGLFRDSVGTSPSIADIIRMTHPKPTPVGHPNFTHTSDFYSYLIGKVKNPELYDPFKKVQLPTLVIDYERFKAYKAHGSREVSVDNTAAVPNVPFQMLDSLSLTTDEWRQVVSNAGWQMTRMNLNTFKRHGVFDGKGGSQFVDMVAARLRDQHEVAKARVFPYQLLMAYTMTEGLPHAITEALQDAMEHAITNVPTFAGKVVICPDVSPSMRSPITGARGAPSKVHCIDVAALMAAAVLRRNPDARLLPFADKVFDLRINARDSVMTIAKQIAALPGNGTACGLPLNAVNTKANNIDDPDLVIYVSDNESWMDGKHLAYQGPPYTTLLANEWGKLKKRRPSAKLVCIDLMPNTTSQATTGPDRLNIGGFSDVVFDVIAEFVQSGKRSGDHWVDTIERVAL